MGGGGGGGGGGDPYACDTGCVTGNVGHPYGTYTCIQKAPSPRGVFRSSGGRTIPEVAVICNTST